MFKVPLTINIAFTIVMCDVLINYFCNVFYRHLPVLAIVPVFFAAYLIFNNDKLALLRPKHISFIAIGIFAYTIGTITATAVPFARFLELLSAFTAWLVGYFWYLELQINSEKKENTAIWWFILAFSLIHAIVCVIALLRISPALFPTDDFVWSLNGTLIVRPSVTTDQNFQIFYLLPFIGIFLFSRSVLMISVSLLGIGIGLFVLAQLQTRSGILVLFLMLLAGVFMQLFAKGSNKIKPVATLIVLFFSGTIFFILKAEYFSMLLIRFTDTDYSTGLGRLHSFEYFLEKISNPIWWIPQGNDEYIALTGDVPHSNITAHLMEGGILGVVTWVALIAAPAIKLCIYIVKYGSPLAPAAVSVTALAFLVTQMTLNVPFVDPIWLWGGVSCAAIEHIEWQQYKKHSEPVTHNTA